MKSISVLKSLFWLTMNMKVYKVLMMALFTAIANIPRSGCLLMWGDVLGRAIMAFKKNLSRLKLGLLERYGKIYFGPNTLYQDFALWRFHMIFGEIFGWRTLHVQVSLAQKMRHLIKVVNVVRVQLIEFWQLIWSF